MKKIFLLAALQFCVTISFSQWQPDARLSNDTAVSFTSYSNAWCIASSDDTVHVVWFDGRDGNYEIYYKRSADGGLSWGADTRLTNNAAVSEFPSVAASGAVVHVVWSDTRNGDNEIYYIRSADGGTSWGAETLLTNNDFLYSGYPSIAVSGQEVHVACEDFRDGNLEIYYKHSTDGGISWSVDTRLTNNAANSENPSVSVTGSVVHIAWKDARDGNNEIYYKRSINGGSTWSADTRLTNNTAHSNGCAVAVTGQEVHVVWYDERDGNREIYYKRSTDGGVTWGSDVRLTNDTAASNNPSVSVSGSVVNVVWHDERDGNKEIYHKRSINGGISWSADARLTNATGVSGRPAISVSGQVVHVVWYDERDGNYEIYYKRDPTGNTIGINELMVSGLQFSLYPNPAMQQLVISHELLKEEKVNLKIFDATGREMWKSEISSMKSEIDMSRFENGIYFVEVASQDKKRVQKLIVQH